jgi:hypothetical protein
MSLPYASAMRLSEGVCALPNHAVIPQRASAHKKRRDGAQCNHPGCPSPRKRSYGWNWYGIRAGMGWSRPAIARYSDRHPASIRSARNSSAGTGRPASQRLSQRQSVVIVDQSFHPRDLSVPRASHGARHCAPVHDNTGATGDIPVVDRGMSSDTTRRT